MSVIGNTLHSLENLDPEFLVTCHLCLTLGGVTSGVYVKQKIISVIFPFSLIKIIMYNKLGYISFIIKLYIYYIFNSILVKGYRKI